MKIAFTTSDKLRIDAHFGSAKKIDVYEVDQAGYNFLKTFTFGGNLEEDGNEDKLLPKIEALTDCAIVYTSTIGPSAAGRLLKHKITPLKAREEGQPVNEVLDELVNMLNGSPPPWLRKVVQLQSKSFDFDDFYDEDSQEEE
jgi:nitrogen fixation protein NifX